MLKLVCQRAKVQDGHSIMVSKILNSNYVGPAYSIYMYMLEG